VVFELIMSNFDMKYSSAVASIFYGVISGELFWGLAYFVDVFIYKRMMSIMKLNH